jgi:hypothetical protein
MGIMQVLQGMGVPRVEVLVETVSMEDMEEVVEGEMWAQQVSLEQTEDLVVEESWD